MLAVPTLELRRAERFALALIAVACVECAASPSVRLGTGAPALAPAPPVGTTASTPAERVPRKPKVIVFVWDGLRPDSLSQPVTPNLLRLRDHEGVDFTDQHAAYPTFTMMNAAAFATGAYAGEHGFYGNTEYQPGASGNNADGKSIDFSQPIFTEDHGVLQALDGFYRARGGRGLFAVDTLFQAAHAAGLRTAAIGKVGPAFMQDYRPDDALSVILDENIAAPFGFARALQGAGFALPANSVHYASGAGQTLLLATNNGKPSAPNIEKIVRLKDGATPDPRSALGSAHDAANEYLMGVYLDYVLPKVDPDLSVVWLRNPDSTEHQFGPGSANYLDALRNQDALLGKLLAKLTELGLRASTDLIVVSDHGHSTVSGDPAIFPLRALTGEPDGHGEVGAPDANGYSVSGEVRSADILTRAGFKHVYDGGGCVFDPVLSGIRKDGSLVYPTRTDMSGQCRQKPVVSVVAAAIAKGKPPPFEYSMPAFRVPAALPKDAIVVAANGGSEYFYVQGHARATVQRLVLALQERRAFGAIFVRNLYGAIAGTLPLSAIRAENAGAESPMPDLIVSFGSDEAALVGGSAGLPGTEYASAQRYRGMHGSFSARDVHNTLIAVGPHFKAGFRDSLPTGNVDIAPTVASLLGLHFSAPDGRVLSEALVGPSRDYRVDVIDQSSDSLRLGRTCQPDDLACARPGAAVNYSLTLHTKLLTVPDMHQRFTYFDRATVSREPLNGPESVALPGAVAPVSLDYIFYEPTRARVWVPAGGTGSVAVLDLENGQFRRVDGFKTAERAAHGKGRIAGPSAGAIGERFAYIGNRATREVCAIDLETLVKGHCLQLADATDGVEYVPSTRELWVTTPSAHAIAVLDAPSDGSLALKTTIHLTGEPEGDAFDETRGLFLTNLEDKGNTLGIDLRTYAVRYTWNPGCSADGPRGIAADPNRGLVFVACTDHVQVLDSAHDGALLGRLETGAGLDNIDYVASSGLLYAAAAKAARLTTAHVDAHGKFNAPMIRQTVAGARNAIADANGNVYVADSGGARLLLFRRPQLP